MFLNVLLLSKALAAPPGQFSVLTEDSSPMIDGLASQQNNINFTTDTLKIYSFSKE